MNSRDAPAFSSPEVEAAYWDAVHDVRNVKNAPPHLQEARRRALLRWLPTSSTEVRHGEEENTRSQR